MNYFPQISNQDAVSLYQEKLEKALLKNENNASIKAVFNQEKNQKLLRAIFSNSPYLSDIIIEYPAYFAEILQNDFQKFFDSKINELQNIIFENKQKIEEKLRIEKRKFSLLIATQEITDFSKASYAMENLSKFADICVQITIKFLLQKAHNNKIINLNDYQNPFLNSGLVVLAIGKLGSYELNYSSDIDIIIFFEDEKINYNGRKTIQQFYIELSQELTDILARRTSLGYVFRVDMRLRPDPASNPLAVSLQKAEKYYFTVGQNWERAAMIKARAICGDENSIKIFFEFMDKNVWRKSLDFETIEDIHSIKRQIDTKNILDENLFNYNVKLGRGGIREIEFFAQTQQLIWGGRKPNLREKKTILALNELAKEGEISSQIASELTKAYNFYRMVEHRLQMVNDEQTHKLPDNIQAIEKIANFCGFEDYKKFIETLRNYIENVRGYYSKLFETSPSLASNIPEAQGSLVFTGAENHPDTIETLKKMGFNKPETISDIVRGWHHGRYNCTMKARSRAVLTKLMPILISSFANCPDADEGFIRFDEFLSRLPTGTQIFSMLYVNPSIIELIADVMGGYPEIAETLTRNHSLLDFVLTSEFYDSMPDQADLKNNLLEHISKASKNKILSSEEIFEIIKNWANDRKFKVGIQFIRDQINSEELFLSLSNIAEIVIKTLIEYIEKEFLEEFGGINNGNFAVIALGKFGSNELTFKSDLDMMFIYDYENSASINENLKIEPSAYYIRLANKLVQILSGISSTGRLYEVDLRLRPLGESSPIATSLKTFEEYYNPAKKEGNAWVWEYMTLTRARVISNNQKFSEKIQNLIDEKISTNWDNQFLQEEVNYIYKKFREHRNSKKILGLDVKNSVGGIFDLEFMLRFLQLKFLNNYPQIKTQSSKKLIENLKEIKAISADEADILKKAFEFLTSSQNVLRITSESKITKYTEEILCKVTNQANFEEYKKSLEFLMAEVKNIFTKHINFN